MKFVNGVVITENDIKNIIVRALNFNPYHDKFGKFAVKDGKELSQDLENLIKVINPSRSNINCTSCVIALESSVRGNNRVALDVSSIQLERNPAKAFVDEYGLPVEVERLRAKNRFQLFKELDEKIKEGTRYMVRADLFNGSGNENVNHVFMALKDRNGLLMVDPQDGSISRDSDCVLLRKINYSGNRVLDCFRIDDKKINEDFLNEVTK